MSDTDSRRRWQTPAAHGVPSSDLVGLRAHTPDKTMPISTGTIKRLSLCRQYAAVEKRYGSRAIWIEWHKLDRVEIEKPNEQVSRP